uniref:Adenylate cyclase n=1 Tax=Bombyx mori TaxID=7091 RepID=A0A8R2R0K3_BOMMO|nr:proton-coupled folate transporter isoform X3 [Bombyx mori]
MTLRVEVPGEKVVSVEPCKCNKQYSKEINTENKLSRDLKESLKKIWRLRTKITVEPFVICYVLPSVLAGLAVQNMCLEKSCLVNLQYDEETCRHIMQGRTQNYTEQEKKVQRMVTTMSSWSSPLQTAPPGILALFIGAWSDRTGNRKAFMIVPILGKLISAIGVMLSAVFFRQVGMNETALLEGLLPALAGGRVAMTMAVYSYISDITSESERTFRIGIVTAVLTLSKPVGLALSGIMTSNFGYKAVFVTACFIYMFGFIYILLRIKEKKKKTVDGTKLECVSLFSLSDLVATVKVGFKAREGTHRVQVILILICYMLIVGPLLGSFITIYLFSKRWKFEDSMIGVIACFSRILASIVYAVAPNRTVYFLGPVLDMFSSAGATSLRSLASKLVDSDEVGKTSSLISISEALVPVIYSPLYGYVYKKTMSTYSGGFYLISTALALPATVILIILYVLRSKEAREAKRKQETKKESEITRF